MVNNLNSIFKIHHITSDKKSHYCIFDSHVKNSIINLSDFPVHIYFIDNNFQDKILILDNIKKRPFNENFFKEEIKNKIEYTEYKYYDTLDNQVFFKRIANYFRSRVFNKRNIVTFLRNELRMPNRTINDIITDIYDMKKINVILCYCGRTYCFMDYFRQRYDDTIKNLILILESINKES